MLKINLEDLVINSIINVYDGKENISIDDEVVLKYRNDLVEKLQKNNIFYVIKIDADAYKKLEENSIYIDIVEQDGKSTYRMKSNIKYQDLLETRNNLSDDLIEILNDQELKQYFYTPNLGNFENNKMLRKIKLN